MKVIKDAFMAWLDLEIAKPNPKRINGRDITIIHDVKVRRATLLEVRSRLQAVIEDEFKKMEPPHA